MPYFRIDEGWWSHPKTMALSPESQALWCRSGAWSMQHFTDGLIPKSAYAILGAKPRLIAELVAVGYWEKVLPGHQFHDWQQYQETAESLKKRRDRNKERMRSVRAHNADTLQTRAPDVRDVIPSHPIPSTQPTDEQSSPTSTPADDDGLISAATHYRFDGPRVRRELAITTDALPSTAMVMAVATAILARAKNPPRDVTAFLVSSIRKDPHEAAQIAWGAA